VRDCESPDIISCKSLERYRVFKMLCQDAQTLLGFPESCKLANVCELLSLSLSEQTTYVCWRFARNTRYRLSSACF
jgi:hypothetical protein